MVDRLPLRTKIVLIPILCAATLLTLGYALSTMLSMQRTVLDEVTGAVLNRSQTPIDVLSTLSTQHIAIVDLLSHAISKDFDEEAVYEAGEQSLLALVQINAVVDELVELFSRTDAEVALIGQIEQNLADYKIAAASAIEMSTVEAVLAGRELISANISFEKLNRGFLRLVALAKAEMYTSLGDLSDRSKRRHTQIIGVAMAG